MSLTFYELVVTSRTVEADDIVSFELQDPAGGPLPKFSAGAHLRLRLPNGLERQYSIYSAPAERHRYLIAVLKTPDSRGGSACLHESINIGDRLPVAGPNNHFPLHPGAHESLLLAGGIGVTPLLCMAEVLAHQGQRFTMHYCTRSASRTAFLGRVAESGFGQFVRFHYDDAPAGDRFALADVLAACAPGAHLYVCGPGGFISFVLNGARERGWDESRLHREYFASAEAPPSGATSFALRIASTGRLVEVPAGVPATRALMDAGISVPTSCEQGVCGTCLTGVLDGVPDHKDEYLTAEERLRNDRFLPCCSRAVTPILVLDL